MISSDLLGGRGPEAVRGAFGQGEGGPDRRPATLAGGPWVSPHPSSCRGVRSSLVNQREEIAADLLGPGPAVADDALGGAQDLDPHAAQDRLEVLVAGV